MNVQPKKKPKAPRLQNAPVAKEGSLEKLGGVVPIWRSRYFVVRGGVLEYYIDKLSWLKSNAPKGSLALLGATVSKKSESEAGKRYVLGLNVPAFPDRVFQLAADSEEEQLSWLQCLSKEIDGARQAKQEKFDRAVSGSFDDFLVTQSVANVGTLRPAGGDCKAQAAPSVSATVKPQEKGERCWLEKSMASSVPAPSELVSQQSVRPMYSVAKDVDDERLGRPGRSRSPSDVSTTSEASEGADPYSEWDVTNRHQKSKQPFANPRRISAEAQKEGQCCSCIVS